MSTPDRQYPVLPETEIRELVRQYQAGDNCAADRIILHNEGMIANVARRYYVTGVTGDTTFDDLMQLGRMGMLRALRDFDPDNGSKFTTYAYAWVREGISRYGKLSGQAVTLSHKAIEKRGRAGRAIAEFQQANGREPTQAELAAITGMDAGKLESLRVNVVSIELDKDDDRRSLADVLVDPDADVENEASERADAVYNLAIWQAVDKLPPTWKTVILMRYSQKPSTLAQVAAHLGISRERVREIEKQSYQFLKKSPFLSSF
jgi:RNA polymerase sigma factor (sigma-70 family)